jgi:hypothetical protein
MKAKDLIKNVVSSCDLNSDSVEKLIALAYYMGREEATREISDKYNALIKAQHDRANACRYRCMANKIVGDQDHIYSGDYAGEITNLFGGDETQLDFGNVKGAE